MWESREGNDEWKMCCVLWRRRNRMKIFEMFAGYGGASFALEKADIDFECVGFSEIDKYAIQCYEQNHCLETDFNTPEGWKREKPFKNFGDCTKIDPKEIPDFDLLTGGFPCQSFSNAGKGLGELDTRGTLFNEIIRIAEVKKPRYMLLENVKGLIGKKHKATFDKILSELERIGYFVRWNVLNSKNFGIPQNRERVWIVYFRDDVYSRDFKFPKPTELKLFLKDVLEAEVDEKYYLKKQHILQLISKNDNYYLSGKIYRNGDCGNANRIFKPSGVCQSIQSSTRTKVVGNVNPSGKGMNGNVHFGDVAPTLTTNKGEGPKIIQIRNATKKGYLEATPCDGISLEHPDSKTRRGRVQKQISPTLQCNDSKGVVLENYRIRKLTPLECNRLQGFIGIVMKQEGISNSQRYKLAGNGWEINLVSKIFKEMFK